jgi:hypothetical protein
MLTMLKNLKIKKVNYLGFDHEKVKKEFEGSPSFVNYMCIEFKAKDTFTGEPTTVYKACAVYYVLEPNLKKNHKNYMLLYKSFDSVLNKSNIMVTGKTIEEMEEFRFQSGVACLGCNTALYSLDRHHFHSCNCPNETFVDGGRDYLRSGGLSREMTKRVKIDLLINEVSPLK